MKRIIILVSIFIAVFTSFAFADDEVMDYVTLPDSRIVELPSINATSSIYSIDDVYRILNSWNYPSGSSWIQTKDSALHLDLTTTNNRLNDIKSAINNQDFSQLHSDLTTVNTSISSGNTQNHSDLTTVNTSISSGNTQNHSDITTVNTSITSGNAQNHSDLTTVNSSITSGNTQNHSDLTSFQNDFNNMNWITSGVFHILDSSYNDVTSSLNTIPRNQISNYYFAFNHIARSNLGQPLVRKLIIPLRFNGNNNIKLDIKLYNGPDNLSTLYPIESKYYSIGVHSDYIEIFLFNVYTDYFNTIAVKFINQGVSGGSFLVYNTASSSHSFLVSDNPESYEVIDFILTQHLNNNIDVFKELYASDDLIAAKQAQQSVEDATLSEFTGNGSSSAKVSDITSTKNAQKAVKDSLDTGASASNISNIVGVNSGFFSFFSQSVSDSVNNPSLSRQTRDINNPDYVPDLLSQNEREYWRLINGDNR